jgi:hypothetical protein
MYGTVLTIYQGACNDIFQAFLIRWDSPFDSDQDIGGFVCGR